MATKSERSNDNDRRAAAIKAAAALEAGDPRAVGAVAGSHTGSETCAQTIARLVAPIAPR